MVVVLLLIESCEDEYQTGSFHPPRMPWEGRMCVIFQKTSITQMFVSIQVAL